jgi:diaminopimelate decarboxylase
MASDLNPVIWPASATRDSQGELSLGEITVTDLANQYGTPLYVFDEADVRKRARDYVAAFTVSDIETSVHYAGKAFLTTKVAQWVNQEGLGIDVASAGELEVALRAGIDPTQIVMHGNNKSVKDLERAVEVGVGRVVIDSLIEIERLNSVAASSGIVQQVLLRLTVGVEAHTHEAISTAHEDQKFGLSVASGMAMTAVDNVLECDSLSLAGLHSHIGSQIFDATGFELATHRVVDFAVQVKERHGISVSEIDVGGGMGIAYVEGDDPLDVDAMAKSILDIVRTECARVNISVPRISVEPGRAIIGNPGITLYEVGTVKPIELDSGITRHYISVDGGMSDNIRTALYDAEYTAVIANRVSTAKLVPSRVVGKHCESGDIVVRDIELPSDTRPGDLIAVAATGAYCRSMASNYNHIPRPAAVSVLAGASQVLLHRETIEDLLAFDAGVN